MLPTILAGTVLAQSQTPKTPTATLTGTIEKIDLFESKILKNKRRVWTYLPPGYEEAGKRRYPVLYCHDGQNVFDGATSYIPGMEWRVDEAANALILANLIEPIIVVAVANYGLGRSDEYLPTRFKIQGSEMGGKGDLYGRFLVEEVKPFIDGKYRTKTGARDTALMGSSLGGVITYYLGVKYPSVFSKLALLSPSIWVNDRDMVKATEKLPRKLPLKIWVDMGSAEGLYSITEANQFFDSLLKKGWIAGKDAILYHDGFAKHNEEAWARRVPAILMWFFGKSRS